MTERVGGTAGRGIDWPSAAMALATAIALSWVAWSRLRPEPISEPPSVGSPAPPLSLTDPETQEPLLLLGRPGHVLWVTFWSPEGRGAAAEIAELDRIWRRFRGRRRFVLVAAVIDPGLTKRSRSLLAKASPELPVYLASKATCRAYGAVRSPLHVLIDDQGRLAAVVRGDGQNLERMLAQAERLLDEIAPPGGRFAMHFRDHDPAPDLIRPSRGRGGMNRGPAGLGAPSTRPVPIAIRGSDTRTPLHAATRGH